MNAINRFKVIWVSTNVKLLLLMGLAYGIVFGGIGQGFALAAGESTIGEFIVNILIYGAGYECMFLFVILIVILALNIKGYISLGMDRLTVYKIWRDVLLYITGFMILVLNVIMWLVVYADKTFLKNRILNIDFNNMDILNVMKVMVLTTLAIVFLNLSSSIVTNIGNRFGMINCFATIALFLGIIILSIPKIILLILWGEGFAFFCIGLFLINCALFLGNKKLIINTEVAR